MSGLGGLGGGGSATGSGHAGGSGSSGSGGSAGSGSAGSSGTGTIGTGTGSGTGSGSGSGSGSGGGVTFGTYISFNDYGSTPWIYGAGSSSPSATVPGIGGASAAFPTTGVSSSTGSAAALRDQLDRLRIAFLTAFVDLVRQRNLELLLPQAASVGVGATSRVPPTIALQVTPPSAASIQQAYQQSTGLAGSILSIVA